jgi:acetylornithine/succinyldiaminopimelate/putrescine aminotransferase
MSDSFSNRLAQTISSRSNENFSLFADYINPSFVKLITMAGFGRRFISSSGFEMIDDNGNRHLDFVSGYGTLNIGHNHPMVKDALKRVIEMDIPGYSQVECGIMTGLAANALADVLPAALDKVYFCNSGSEAVDSALKLARGATGKKRFVYCEKAFHGNTLGVLGITDNPKKKNRFRPFFPGTTKIPFGDMDALSRALKWGDVAALVVEPVQGEGGVVVSAPDFLAEAIQLCRQKGALLIADEVQTGFGRTGRMFAFEHSGIVPDVVTLAKSMSGGYIPCGAMVTSEKVFGKAFGSMNTCLDQRNTFGGNPLAMTALMATLHVLKEENLVEKAKTQGTFLKEQLIQLQEKHHLIMEIRGMGLMLGIKFGKIPRSGLSAMISEKPDAALSELFTQHVVIQLLKRHRIITQVGANDFSVLKIMPPLNISRPALETFISALDDILSDGGYATALLALAKGVFSKNPERATLSR